jgi:hypothetical protein
MKVWVVTWSDWCGGCEVHGAFSTKERAEAYRAKHPGFYNEPVEVEVDQE